MIIKTPAKINLTLAILSPRPNGYHGIRSLMQTVGIYDKIALKPLSSGEIKLKCSWGVRGVPEPEHEKNLAYRAAVLLKHYLDEKCGAEIMLEKRIPAGAGLGGGSSDAAAVLLGLCKVWKKRVPGKILNKLAAKLGADVAFFLKGGCCLAEGIGEKVTSLKTSWDKKPLWIVLVKPAFSTSTKEIYRKLDAYRKTHKVSQDLKVRSFAKNTGGLLRLEDLNFINELEPVVVKVHPQIESIKKQLVAKGAAVAMMSGSGSSVFGIFPNRADAASAAVFLKLHLKSSAIFLTTTVNKEAQ